MKANQTKTKPKPKPRRRAKLKPKKHWRNFTFRWHVWIANYYSQRGVAGAARRGGGGGDLLLNRLSTLQGANQVQVQLVVHNGSAAQAEKTNFQKLFSSHNDKRPSFYFDFATAPSCTACLSISLSLSFSVSLCPSFCVDSGIVYILLRFQIWNYVYGPLDRCCLRFAIWIALRLFTSCNCHRACCTCYTL